MKYSKLLGKTRKEAPKDEESVNAQLLIRAGFIQKEMAGVYAFLPLGYRVLQKITEIIREEMNAIGGQELFLGSLQDPETWKTTNRWSDDAIDVWFKTSLRGGTEVGLANTHEEPLTKILAKYVQSYKDLPIYTYQLQTKFRNELRAKNGLLRTREFIMKDLYSFNKDEKGLEKFYEEAKLAYKKIFDRLGFGDKTFVTLASGGPFSKFSHEFQTVCETGEDTIYLDRKKKLAINKEVYSDDVISEVGLKKEELEEVRAIEVGNIFKLGTRFSEPLGLTYTDEDGSESPVVMGSYGIAPSRSMGAIVELFNDDKGIVWPENLAPYAVHLVGLNSDDSKIKQNADSLYEKLADGGVEALYDDRSGVSAGEKLADADLIGCPYRVVVSQKTGDKVEIKKRTDSEEKIVSFDELLNQIT